MAAKNSGKLADDSSLFIIAIPFALFVIVVVKTWKLILAIIFLGVGWRFWQQYEWQQTKAGIDPTFQLLLKDNRGSITVLDLTQAAQIPSSLASKYLLGKARLYGAQLLSYGDDRDTYHFLTAGILQDILADSEPETTDPPRSPALDKEVYSYALPALSHENSHEETPSIAGVAANPPTTHSENLAEHSAEKIESRQSIDYFPDANS
ncbi:MAG: hypothetical protein HC916_06630 [Coleofasciculaceae cyanobacterium SM2_1_6]|nr:hypothetical protein [Coleofasciculaceae cyanobacterium SM2_1_6]